MSQQRALDRVYIMNVGSSGGGRYGVDMARSVCVSARGRRIIAMLCSLLVQCVPLFAYMPLPAWRQFRH